MDVLKKSKGQIKIPWLIGGVLAMILVTMVAPAIQGNNVATATSYLTERGYVVLSAGEYALIAKEATAVAAVLKAETAATAANETLTTLLLHNENETFIFPDSTAVNVTLTAGAADTYGAWAEVVAANATALSACFAANDGYLVEISTRDYSANTTVTYKEFVIELATANDGTEVIGRVKVRSDWTYVLALRSARITAGDTIYYRMKAGIAGAQLVADFRYYYR